MPVLLWIFLGLIVCVGVYSAIFFKNSTLEKLPLLIGEKILFEDDEKLSFQSVPNIGTPTQFPLGHVRITNKRIILSQATLLSKKTHPLRFVIQYAAAETEPEGDLKETLKQGYQSFSITLKEIAFEEDKGKECLIIEPQGSHGGIDFKAVRICPQDIGQYRRVFPLT